MAPLANKLNNVHSFSDYLNWPDDERWEIIEGIPYNMTPAPHPSHQKCLAELIFILKTCFQNRECVVYPAPFDVRFADKKKLEDKDIINVVQPDISVICDNNKIDDRGCLGAPDLIVEILSPGTAKKDFNEKFSLYEKHKVKEYWIADPGNRVLHIYSLNKKNRLELLKMFEKNDSVESSIFKDLSFSLPDIF